jgi:hypothetical protein
MRRLFFVAGVLATLVGQLFAQDNPWKPLGGWQLVEWLDDVQIVKVLRKGDLMPAIFPPKPTWQPDAGDFFPASDVLLYRRMPASTAASSNTTPTKAITSCWTMRTFGACTILRAWGGSASGSVEIMRSISLYVGYYTIQGFWTGSDDDLPPFPTSGPPNTFLRSNRGTAHSCMCRRRALWRLAYKP